MGTKLSTSSLESTPVINVRGDKGQYFVGKLLSHKTTPSQYKDEKTGEPKVHHIYEFAIEDTNMRIERKEGKEYVEAKVIEGDTVSIFAPTRLNNALRQATAGQRITIKYLGMGKATKFGGKPHDYEVEVDA